jgi:hypothetical protein
MPRVSMMVAAFFNDVAGVMLTTSFVMTWLTIIAPLLSRSSPLVGASSVEDASGVAIGGRPDPSAADYRFSPSSAAVLS